MADKLTQANRPIQIETPLDDDALIVRSVEGSEAISEIFSFRVEAISENGNINGSDIIGKGVTLRIQCEDIESWRLINGVVSRFSLGVGALEKSNFAVYRLEIVPWLWFLTRTADCVIFQNKSSDKIISDIFRRQGFSGYSKNLCTGSYSEREFCVQYRETASQFVRRLMEEEGICFFFDHEEQKHTLLMADSVSNFKPGPLGEKFRWDASYGPGHFRGEEVVYEWSREYEVRPRKWAQTDYNFKTPNTFLLSTVDTLVSNGVPNYEVFDFPGRFETSAEADRFTKLRMEEEEARYDVIYGRSDIRALIPGYRWELEGHPRRDQNGKYLVTSVTHRASQGNTGGTDEDEAFSYENSFTCIPVGTPYRHPRVTPKPLVHGTQTAVVVGPAGEEIYTDQFGRVKVQFRWDREAKKDENSSCWIRVSQPMAGKGWGALYLPRIGQEVLVDFLEGDPDRPVIVGRVYNADCMPPYKLPDEQTKSTMKTLSSKGGGGFNEIRFEDKKGSEQLFFNAEKDIDVRAKEVRKEWIGQDTHLIVGQDKFEQVKGDFHLQTSGDKNEKVTGTVSLNAGQDYQEKVGQSYAMQAGTEIYLKAGMNLVLESGTSLTLKVGGNFINLNPAGIAITGTMVMINSGGSAGSGAGCSPHPPKDPLEADKAIPGEMTQAVDQFHSKAPPVYSPAALVLKNAAQTGAPFCET